MDFLSKTDLMGQYNVTKYTTFAKLIGEKGRKILEWSPGHQRYTPKQVRELKKLIGEPLEKHEKYA